MGGNYIFIMVGWDCFNYPNRKFYEGPPGSVTCCDCGKQSYMSIGFFTSTGLPYKWVQHQNHWTFVMEQQEPDVKQVSTPVSVTVVELPKEYDPESLSYKLKNMYFV